MIVNLNLTSETAQRLSDKAAREGQTIEKLLEKLAEAEVATNGTLAHSDELPQDEDRPWRGVFHLDYPRQEMETAEKDVCVNALPPLPPDVRIDPRRLADDSE